MIYKMDEKNKKKYIANIKGLICVEVYQMQDQYLLKHNFCCQLVLAKIMKVALIPLE